MNLHEESADSFRINNNVNLYLLHAIGQEHLADLSASKGRNEGEQFAHIHNVRLMWTGASAPELMVGLQKIEKGNFSKKLLSDGLKASSEGMQKMLLKGFEAGRIKNEKPHPASFLGYLLAHEGHHRGQIMLSLNKAAMQRTRKYNSVFGNGAAGAMKCFNKKNPSQINGWDKYSMLVKY